jgi:hypothetical protein
MIIYFFITLVQEINVAKVKEIVKEKSKPKAVIKAKAEKKAIKKSAILSFVVPDSLNKKLLSYAKDKKLSRSYVGREALEKFLAA